MKTYPLIWNVSEDDTIIAKFMARKDAEEFASRGNYTVICDGPSDPPDCEDVLNQIEQIEQSDRGLPEYTFGDDILSVSI